ncbi:Glutamate carboxypeptidase [Madurella fahalii]|uniref:Glutamate carboxypeptidase n=1 Tax=Madurella fahalii TaxID=1157608 RepID=A0ABQ0GNG6_9PEZI
MAPGSDQRYDPVPPIPTYDEAVGVGGSSSDWHSQQSYPHSPVDDDPRGTEAEGQSLLTSRHAFESSTPIQQPPRGRQPRGYRPPTVETDDESDLFSSDDSDSDGETEHVRREMQELEIDDSDVDARNRSTWGKRIGLSLSLPQWRWRWRWKLPRLRRRDGPGTSQAEGSGGENADSGEQAAGQRLALPKLGSTALLILVARILGLLMVLAFLYLLFASNMFSSMARRMGNQVDPEKLRVHVQAHVDPRRIREHLKHFTSYAHLAGTEGDYALMEDTEMLFRKYGLEGVTRDVYSVYLNYPKAGGRAVEILGQDGKPVWSAKLEENDTGGKTAGRQTYIFHGHSKTGIVKGPLVYANYGSREDFQALKDSGIDTHGAIALVRNHGSVSDHGLKVKAAELAGFAGCIIYSDPIDDGFVKGETAPNGRFLPADGVHRGSVSLRNWIVGDVLTPTWGSRDNLPRLKLEQAKGLVKIPSLPLAWRDAQILLQHLKGFGRPVPDQWAGGVPGVEWWTGNGSSPIVRLKNDQDEIEKQPIWNVYGRIPGAEQSEKKVIIGNHRDSFAFGAADPHSGTAVMLEVARILGDLYARGTWQPLRTIEFMSWDGEQYNLIGSTEYVEQNDDDLRRDALAYINLDGAVTGGTFRAAGSPVFRSLLAQTLNRVSDPYFNTTLRDLWDRRRGDIDDPLYDTDSVPFQDIAGTSSLDVYFDGGLYPHRSSYDNFEWMVKNADSDFVYHTLLGQVLGLLVIELSDRPILPFDMTAYADDLSRRVKELDLWVKKQQGGKKLSLNSLTEASNEVAMAVREFNKWERSWEASVVAAHGWEPTGLGKERCEFNSRMAKFESDLLDIAGIPNRTQFKHVVFGPPQWPAPGEGYYHFPAIRDTVLVGNWTLAQETVDKVAGIIKEAAANLAR